MPLASTIGGAAPGMGFRLVKAERDQQPEAAAVFAPSPVVVRLEARAAPHPRFWTARTPIEPPQLAIIRITSGLRRRVAAATRSSRFNHRLRTTG